MCHFPIFACHPVFNDFVNIVLERKYNNYDYEKFIYKLGNGQSEAIDKGIRGLIKVILLRTRSSSKTEATIVRNTNESIRDRRTNYSNVSDCKANELDFVELVVEELKSIFPKVESQILVHEGKGSN